VAERSVLVNRNIENFDTKHRSGLGRERKGIYRNIIVFTHYGLCGEFSTAYRIPWHKPWCDNG
jgi:hypothetical protein